MAILKINGIAGEFDDDVTLFQACREAGIEIPHFCYHERLSIAGNCRMCLVEVKGMGKLQASCALSVGDLRPGRDGSPPEIMTSSDSVHKARAGVMEFLLINHPLDCPICDQGGECDLQDQAVAYGSGSSRFADNKRSVEDKYIGPLVKTQMTRCIHCTRCVRFVSEVCGVGDLGAIGRGEDMEITTYLEASLGSELQGNVIDLCPVGALTSGSYAFRARPWELTRTDGIDVMDGIGSNIRIDSRGGRVLRILPRIHEDVNEEWISDKTRFVCDGLSSDRLDRAWLRGSGGRLKEVSWDRALSVLADRLGGVSSDSIGFLSGDMSSVEEIFAFKGIADILGVRHLDCRPNGSVLGSLGGRCGYLLNTTIAGIEDADSALIIGCNPRFDAPLVNTRLRKCFLRGDFPVGLIGSACDVTYPYRHLGEGSLDLRHFADGGDDFMDILSSSARPLILLGEDAVTGVDGDIILGLAAQIASSCGAVGHADWNGFSVLHRSAARVGGLELCFLPRRAGGLGTHDMLSSARQGTVKVLWLLGVDEIDMDGLDDCFVVYQGSHGDRGARHADLILPSAAWTEQSGIYVNIEGRVQMTNRAVFPPGEAREGWSIFRALSSHLSSPLPYNSLSSLRSALFAEHGDLSIMDLCIAGDVSALEDLRMVGKGALQDPDFVFPALDSGSFYETHAVARASSVLRDCASLARSGRALSGVAAE